MMGQTFELSACWTSRARHENPNPRLWFKAKLVQMFYLLWSLHAYCAAALRRLEPPPLLYD